MDKGIFIISLDFELAWGFHYGDKARGPYKENILGARSAVPKLLELFDLYGIHVTWATVGALGCASKEELLQLIPQDVVYVNMGYSLHQYIDTYVGDNEEEDPLHYAPSLVNLIRSTPNQYLGSHTFSHFLVVEDTLDREDFHRDAVALKTIYPEASTVVFARNQISREGIAVLKNHGFKAYRGVSRNRWPIQIYEEKQTKPLYIRVLRLIDTYLPITGHYDYLLEEVTSEQETEGLLNIRASATLRPYNPSLAACEELKLKRIKRGMERAAAKGGVYHLYWHPHNFGINQQKNMSLLEEILKYYLELHARYGMETMSMEEVCDLLGAE